LRRKKYQAELAGVPFGQRNEFDAAVTRYEQADARVAELIEEIGNLLMTVDRCVVLLKNQKEGRNSGGQQLVAVGGIEDVRIAIEETSSELFVLASICLDAEVYPEFQTQLGDAVVRRSQLLDRMLQREFGQTIFLEFDQDTQFNLGNRLLRAMAATQQSKPSSSSLKTLTWDIESGKKLSLATRAAAKQVLLEEHVSLDHTPLGFLLKSSSHES
jgi:hypothetical protein